MIDSHSLSRRDSSDPLDRRRLLVGAAGWLLFGILLVALRGVRWDEHDKLAAVLLGRHGYPAEHPLVIMAHYVRNAPLLLSAAIAWLIPGPGAVNGFRNVVWIWSTTLPVYLIAARLSNRVLAGNVAAALALSGSYTAFVSNYPMSPWPMFYSNGHVGRGVALFILFLALDRRYRAAWLALGFMPVIHASQALFVGVLLAGAALVRAKQLGVGASAREVAWFIPGAVVVVLFIALPWFSPPVAAVGPYASEVPSADILRAYLATEPLFAPPGVALTYTNSNIVLGIALFLVLAAACQEWLDTHTPGPWAWLGAYFVVLSTVVWGIMTAHYLLGDSVPYLLIAWMPYRFTNHAAVLLPAIVAAIGAAPRRGTGNAVVAAILAAVALTPLFAWFLPGAFFERYVATGEGALFSLVGCCGLMVLSRVMVVRPFYVTWIMAACAGITILTLKHQFGAFCLLAGFSVSVLYGQLLRHRAMGIAIARQTGPWLAAAAALLVVSIATRQTMDRSHLPTSAFEREAAALIRDTAGPKALVAARPDEHGLQCRLNLALLADDATATDMVYVPILAPSIQKLLDELYGIRYFPLDGQRPPWTAVWAERTPTAWDALGARYAFEYVISPDTVPLRLPIVLEGANESLYRIDRAAARTGE